jgi:hypothetical protein
MDNKRALSVIPKLWIAIYCTGRGAFYYPEKQEGQLTVEVIEKQM